MVAEEPRRLRPGSVNSYGDDVYVDGAKSLDIDHMVPLAVSWDSGARDWDAARREAYANDLGEHMLLIAVTARSNRSKSDQDFAEMMPIDADSACRYAFDKPTLLSQPPLTGRSWDWQRPQARRTAATSSDGSRP